VLGLMTSETDVAQTLLEPLSERCTLAYTLLYSFVADPKSFSYVWSLGSLMRWSQHRQRTCPQDGQITDSDPS
jgi:hypothetical protein